MERRSSSPVMIQFSTVVSVSLAFCVLLMASNAAQAQTPETLLNDGFGGQSVNLHQPNLSSKWASPSAPVLKGRLRQESAWYQEGRIGGNAYRPTDAPTRAAEQLVKAYKLDAAEAQFKRLLRQNPNNAGAHHGLALVTYYRTTSSNGEHHSQHNELLAEAVQHSLTALRLQPTYVDANLTLARLYHELLGRTPDAKEYAANAYRLAPQSSGVLSLVGEMLIDEGDVQQAVDVLNDATALNRRNAQAYTQLGRAYAANREYNNALGALNTALWLNPNSAPTHHLMATIYQAQGNQAAAVTFYQKALAIKPEYLPASLDLANLYQSRSNWPQALETLQNAFHSILPENQPELEAMAQAIGDVALANGQPKVAQAYYQQTLKLNPNNLAAQKGLSNAHVKEATQNLAEAQGYGGDLWTEANAQQALSDALKANRGNSTAKLIATKLYGHARSTQELGTQTQREVIETPLLTANDALAEGEVWQARFDMVRSQNAYATAVRSADTPDDAIRVGDMLLTLGQPEQAMAAFNRVLSNGFTGPSSSGFNLNAAQHAARKGMAKATEQQAQSRFRMLAATESLKTDDPRWLNTVQQALALDATNPEAHHQLAQYYDKAGQWPMAIRHYHLFSVLAPTDNRTGQARRRIAALSQKLAKDPNQHTHTGV